MSLNISIFFLFYLSFFHSTFMLSFSLPQIWLYEKLRLLYPPIITPSRYQLKHYRDRNLKDKEMDLAKLIELLNCLTSSDVQWVVEWWHIEAMSSCGFKENFVPLVRLRYYSYHPTCRIIRQFGDRKGVPYGNGSFHTLAFTIRILGRIHETWSWRAMNRDIHFPQFLHPTFGYWDRLSIDMKAVHWEEKDHKKSNKRKRTEWLSWYALNFTFLHFTIPCLFIWVNKGLECSKSPIKTIYHLLIWAMKESIIYYLCLLSFFFFSFFFFSFFLCHVIFAHDILVLPCPWSFHLSFS